MKFIVALSAAVLLVSCFLLSITLLGVSVVAPLAEQRPAMSGAPADVTGSHASDRPVFVSLEGMETDVPRTNMGVDIEP